MNTVVTLHRRPGAAPAPDGLADVLARLSPPDGVALIGAGAGTSSWLQWLWRRQLPRVFVAEGHPGQFRRLRAWYGGQADERAHVPWQLSPAVVGRDDEAVTFHEASLADESGLEPPTQAMARWPRLQVVRAAVQPTHGLDTLLQTFGPCRWILVDCLPALAALQGASARLQLADVIALRVERSGDAGEADPQVDAAMQAHGFCLAGLEPVRHPRLARAWYLRDPRQTLQRERADTAGRLAAHEQREATLEAQLAQQAGEIARLSALLDEYRQQALHEPVRRIGDALQAQQEWLAREHRQWQETAQSLGQRFDTAATRGATAWVDAQESFQRVAADAIKQTVTQTVTQTVSEAVTQAVTQVLTHAVAQTVTPAVGAQLTQGFAKLAAQDLIPATQAAVRRSQSQIESLMGIHHFMATGHGLDPFHGWPISPDLGLALLRCLQDGQHDTLIEFGSGTSTVMLARALLVFDSVSGIKAKPRRRRLLSFDHEAAYHARTLDSLRAQRLADGVDLRLAPLVEQMIDGVPRRFYDCGEALREFDRLAGRARQRILVLVDGPPARSAPLARLPALPLVLQHLGRHSIDLVLDDHGRAEEREIVEHWRTWMRDHGFEWVEQELDCEKGAMHLRINKRELSA